MENIQNITLDVMNNKSSDYIYTKQYDTGRKVVFRITKNGEQMNLSGLTSIFCLKKPDGNLILRSSVDDELVMTNDTITLELTDQITVLSGKLPYQITLCQNDKEVSTVTGYLMCDRAAITKDDMASVSDGSLIEDLAIVAQAIKDGEIHSGDIVNVSATLQSGVEIGEISVNDVPTKLYSPGDFSGNTHGLVPASDGTTTKFLRSDGDWANPFTTTSQSIISTDTASRWVEMYGDETNVGVSNLIVFECSQTPETPYTTVNSQQVAIYTLPISTKVKKIKIALRTFAGYLSSQPDIVIGVKATLDTVNPPSKLDEDWIVTLYENRRATDANLELNVNSESPYYLYIFGWAWNFEISSITLVENVVPTTIPEMSDVNISSLSEGQVLKYNSTTQKWVNANESGGGGGGSALDDLSDVSLNSPSDGDFLMYSSSSGEWENAQLTVPDFDGTNSGLVPEPGSGDSDKFLKADGTWATLASSGAVVDPDFEDAIANGYFTFGYGSMQASGGAGASAVSYGYDDIHILYSGYWLDDGETTYDSVKDSFSRIQTEIDDINTELTNMSFGITTTSISLERGDITNTGYYWDGTHDSLLLAIQSLAQRVASLEAIVDP